MMLELVCVVILLLLLLILISYQSVLGFTIAIVLICALLFLFVLITSIRCVWRGISNFFFPSKDLPKDAAELVRLIKLSSVIEDSNEIVRLAKALSTISESYVGRQSCIDSKAPQMLLSLLKEKTVKEKREAIESIAYTLWKITETSVGIKSCIDAGATLILTELASEKAVKENFDASNYITRALGNINKSIEVDSSLSKLKGIVPKEKEKEDSFTKEKEKEDWIAANYAEWVRTNNNKLKTSRRASIKLENSQSFSALSSKKNIEKRI